MSWYRRPQPEFAVNQREITHVFSVTEPMPLMLVIRPRMRIPQDVEGVKARLGTSEQQVAKLRFALPVEADNLAIQHAPPPSQFKSKPFAPHPLFSGFIRAALEARDHKR